MLLFIFDLGRVFHSFRQLSKHIHCMSVDVANTSEYPGFVKTVETTLNPEGLNLLINNAGISVRRGIDEITEEVMNEHFKVNTIAPLLLVQVRRSHLDDDGYASFSKVKTTPFGVTSGNNTLCLSTSVQ